MMNFNMKFNMNPFLHEETNPASHNNTESQMLVTPEACSGKAAHQEGQEVTSSFRCGKSRLKHLISLQPPVMSWKSLIFRNCPLHSPPPTKHHWTSRAAFLGISVTASHNL